MINLDGKVVTKQKILESTVCIEDYWKSDFCPITEIKLVKGPTIGQVEKEFNI